MVLEQALGKIGLKPAFSTKFKEAVPKTEVLEQPQLAVNNGEWGMDNGVVDMG
jgi:hypothetical protein